ncbi:MAG: hypothetical protein LBC21_02835, partial [Oscillospiraceae bacterium]|jgi:hypothetical protein|nr:hypothetical protein [Oscillospiraceae bacterium]
MRNLTIFAPSHGAHSYAKIHFAVGEKDESAQTAANEFIPNDYRLIFCDCNMSEEERDIIIADYHNIESNKNHYLNTRHLYDNQQQNEMRAPAGSISAGTSSNEARSQIQQESKTRKCLLLRIVFHSKKP